MNPTYVPQQSALGGDALGAIAEMEHRMDKWNLIIDVARCENCNNCVLATKDEHCDNDFPGYAAPQPRHGHEWIKITRRVRGSAPMVDAAYLPATCNHCAAAPCIEAAKDGSVYKRDDGIVIIDPQKAKGRKDLVKACPYGAIWWNEEQQLPQKWIFDAHLLDAGAKEPRCVQSCPTGAMRAVKIPDEAMTALARQQGLEALRPELGAKPRVWYRNLFRFNKCFVGGSVVGEVDGRTECIAGAKVSLLRAGSQLQQATSDAFGDFKFDAIEPRSGVYHVEVTHERFGSVQLAVELGESQYLGKIRLPPARSSPTLHLSATGTA